MPYFLCDNALNGKANLFLNQEITSLPWKEEIDQNLEHEQSIFDITL